jgi:Ca-activated chloride channel family protein
MSRRSAGPGQITDESADETIAQLGLAYNLVTTQTSLVAVDRTPARPKGKRLTREELPLLLPKGWSFEGLFGGELPAHDAAAMPPEQQQALELPQTATGFLGSVLRGLAALAAGLGGLVALRRRKGA